LANVNSREDGKEFKIDRKGKDNRKKIHQILSFHICVVTTYQHLAAFVFVSSVFGEKCNSGILNDIGRNSLLGNRKKLAKFLMRTFTCHSTFLYGSEY
jgi:hypothetical protein